MTHATRFPAYRSQLLRMWVEPTDRRAPVWRFSLEDVQTGARVGFADLDELVYHLLAMMETPADDPPQPTHSLSQSHVGS